MFKKRNIKQQNTAILDTPRPVASPTIHNHAPSEAGKIFAWAIVYLIGGVIGWYFLLHLIESLGYKNPVRVMAYFLFGSAGLIILSIAFYNAVTRILKEYFAYQLQVEEIRAETARSLSLMAAQPRPGESRLTEEDSKFAALLRVVMDEAYRHIYRNPNEISQYSRNEAKPWTRRANTGRVISGFSEPVTEAMASRVAPWLSEKGVIDKSGAVDISDRGYPSFAHFEALLEREYYTPIQVQKALSPILRQDVGFIENS